MRTRYGSLLAALLLLAFPATAETPPSDKEVEKQVDRLFSEWKDLKSNQDVKQQRRRREIANELGAFDHPSCRRALLHILENDRDVRAQIAAMTSIGLVGDLETIHKMVRFVQRETRTVMPDYLGLALAKSKDPQVGKYIVDNLLTHGNKLLRIGCVEALGELRYEGARESLLKMLEYEEKRRRADPHMYYEILRALGRGGGEGTYEVLTAAARDPDWRVRLAPAEVLLEHHRGREAVDVVRTLLHDEKPIVREMAAVAAGRHGLEPLFPDLVVLMREGNLRAKDKSYEALKRLSGQDYGYAPDAWQKWWKDKLAGRLDEAGAIAGDDTVTVSTYYDFKVFSDRVLFVVDVSGSMKWPAYRPNRIEVAAAELKKVIRSLKEETLFNVMTFAGHVQQWQKGEVPATKRNIESALSWVDSFLLPRGGTNTYGALMTALDDNPQVDTIFLLSDGMPSTGLHILPEEILIKLRYANRFRKVVIHTIALAMGRPSIEKAEKYEDPDEMAEFMRMVAEWNQGKCLDIREPPLPDLDR